MASSSVDSVFKSEVLGKRLIPSFVFSTLLSTVFGLILSKVVAAFLFLPSWNPHVIVLSIVYGLKEFFSFSVLLSPVFCNIILMKIHSSSFQVTWWVPQSRLEHLRKVFQLKSIAGFVVMTGVICYLYHHFASLAMPDVTYLVADCSHRKGSCLNYQCLIVLTLGFLYGICFSLSYWSGNLNYVGVSHSYPHSLVQIQLKAQFEAVMEAVRLYSMNVWFYISCFLIYISFGNTVCTFLCTIFHLGSPDQSGSWQHLTSKDLNFRLLLVAVTTFVVLSYHLHCFFSLFAEFMCKPLEIPIEDGSGRGKAGSWTLSNTLASKCEVLQLLSFKYLKEISEDLSTAGNAFRQQVFAISQPGGHPHNWNGIIRPCLQHIGTYTERLRTALLSEAADSNTPIEEMSFKNIVAQKLSMNVNSLKQYPIFCYLLLTLPDSKARKVFAEAQSVIYAIQGLSNIVASSFKHDHYGVVQGNFKEIITALVELQFLVDKQNRSSYQGHRSLYLPKCEISPEEGLKRSLKLTLRSSLYSITDVFGQTLKEVDFSADVQSKVMSYISFREG